MPAARRPCRQGYLLDMTAHRRAEEQLAHVAEHDPLTGLPNWAMFQQRVREAVDRAEAAGRGAAVLLVDLDDFKLVNDSFGHAAGDALVVEAARRLVETVEDASAVSRLGGDEFAILLADLDPGRGGGGTGLAADAMAERVRAALRAPAEIAGTEIYCSGQRRHQPLSRRTPPTRPTCSSTPTRRSSRRRRPAATARAATPTRRPTPSSSWP